jgi:hypothetical protein
MSIKLLTKALVKKLPALYSQENTPDPMVICKFFAPDAGWTWYAIEGSPVDAAGYYDTDKPKVDFLFFGLVCRTFEFHCNMAVLFQFPQEIARIAFRLTDHLGEPCNRGPTLRAETVCVIGKSKKQQQR